MGNGSLLSFSFFSSLRVIPPFKGCPGDSYDEAVVGECLYTEVPSFHR